jgi:hypothetical protein
MDHHGADFTCFWSVAMLSGVEQCNCFTILRKATNPPPFFVFWANFTRCSFFFSLEGHLLKSPLNPHSHESSKHYWGKPKAAFHKPNLFFSHINFGSQSCWMYGHTIPPLPDSLPWEASGPKLNCRGGKFGNFASLAQAGLCFTSHRLPESFFWRHIS